MMGGKKKDFQGSKPNPNSVPNKEVLQRMNFLYQASNLLAHKLNFDRSKDSSKPSDRQKRERETIFSKETSTKKDLRISSRKKVLMIEKETEKSKKNRGRGRMIKGNKKISKFIEERRNFVFRPIENLSMICLSRELSSSIRSIAMKSVLRIDPSIKRSICKSCGLILIPGQTSSNRLKSSGPHNHKLNITCLGCNYKRSIPDPTSSNLKEEEEEEESFRYFLNLTEGRTEKALTLKRKFFSKKMGREDLEEEDDDDVFLNKENKNKKNFGVRQFWNRSDHLVFVGKDTLSI